MSLHRVITLILASLFFIMGIWLASKAFKELDAWALTTRVDADLKIIKAKFGESNHLSWSKGTIVAAERAVLRTPDDAERVMQAGLVWAYVGHMEQGSLDRRRAFQKAITYYERARDLRPAWPHHYRNLHDLYFLTNRSLSERNDMLVSTYKYGKWNRALKLFIAEHTLARPWDRNAETTLIEKQILEYLTNSSNHDSKETKALKARFPASFGTTVSVGLSN